MPTESVQALAERTVHCILFDLGNTLWTQVDDVIWLAREQDANQQAVAFLLEHVDPRLLPSIDTISLGRRIREQVKAQTEMMKRQRLGYEPDFVLATIEALVQLGLPTVDRIVAAAIFEMLRVRIPESRTLFTDTLSTLAALRERGFVLGVVTNRQWGGSLFMEDLHILGLLEYFDPRHIAISADLGVRKPNPAIFLHTLDALSIIPQEAAMVGNSLQADIAGAKSLNIFAVWKPKLSPYRAHLLPDAQVSGDNSHLSYIQSDGDPQISDEVKPDLTIEHLSDLLDVFLKAGRQ